MLKADGFDEAIIGIGRRCGQPDLVVYDTVKMVEILVTRDGMTTDDALEYLEFNTFGAWVGEQTPIFVDVLTPQEFDEVVKEMEATDDDPA